MDIADTRCPIAQPTGSSDSPIGVRLWVKGRQSPSAHGSEPGVRTSGPSTDEALSLSTILPHKPISCTYSREESMADQAPCWRDAASGSKRGDSAPGPSLALPRLLLQPRARKRVAAGATTGHSGQCKGRRNPRESCRPLLLLHFSTSPAGGSGRLHGDLERLFRGLGTVSLTWTMIPFSLYSACRALENVHTKAWSEKEKHLRARSLLSPSEPTLQIPEAPQEPTTLS